MWSWGCKRERGARGGGDRERERERERERRQEGDVQEMIPTWRADGDAALDGVTSLFGAEQGSARKITGTHARNVRKKSFCRGFWHTETCTKRQNMWADHKEVEGAKKGKISSKPSAG